MFVAGTPLSLAAVENEVRICVLPVDHISGNVDWVANAYHQIHSHGQTTFGLVPPPSFDIAKLRTRVRQIKDDKQISINDLVISSGLSRTAIMDMLNGRGRIAVGRIDTWWALAWALEVPFGELMGVLDNPDP